MAPTVAERAPKAQALPLPPAVQPELVSDIESVPNDEPTVDDLPGRPNPSVLPDGGDGSAP